MLRVQILGGGGASITILLYKYHISCHIFKGTTNEISKGGGANQFLGGGKSPPEINPANVHIHILEFHNT